MKILHLVLGITLLSMGSFTRKKDTRYFELRIYHANPGKLNDLISRFRNNTARIFEKHGMENIGYWVPVNNSENTIYYVLAFPDKASRDSSFASFGKDPEWQEVARKSEENGKLVNKISSVFMHAEDISPLIKPSVKNPERIFELRTYHCHPGKLPDLIIRFGKHTKKLFKKHGMENIAYWITDNKNGEQSSLVYILAYKDEEQRKKSWNEFGRDPQWQKAKKRSEENGPIVEKIESVILKPIDFSSIR